MTAPSLVIQSRYPRQHWVIALFTYAALKLWNALPLAIRSVNTVTDFKGKLKTYLFSNAFLLKSESYCNFLEF